MVTTVPPDAHEARASAGFVEVQPLASPACTFDAGTGALLHGLAFVVGGRRFATVDGRVTLERLEIAGDGRRVFASLDTGAVRLSAEVAPTSLRVAQRDASRLELGWLDVRAGTIASVSQGRATVAVKLPEEFEAAPPAIELGCAELTPFNELSPE